MRRLASPPPKPAGGNPGGIEPEPFPVEMVEV